MSAGECAKSPSRYGADVSATRLNVLDSECADYVRLAADSKPNGVDLGCGLGVPSLIFASLGASMTLIDIRPLAGRFQRLSAAWPVGRLSFLQRDVRDLTAADFPTGLTFVYSQRFIHYLTYPEARRVLSDFRCVLTSGGRLFLSASGIASELGDGYPASSAPLDQRFAALQTQVAEKHGIRERVCLYGLDELVQLGVAAGFGSVGSGVTTFGNVWAVFEAA